MADKTTVGILDRDHTHQGEGHHHAMNKPNPNPSSGALTVPVTVHNPEERPYPLPMDLMDWLGKRVLARTGTGGVHAVGRVVGVIDGPTVIIETDHGKHVTWRTHLCAPAADADFDPGFVTDPPLAGGSVTRADAGIHDRDADYDRMGHMLASLIYRVTGRWSGSESLVDQYDKAMSHILTADEVNEELYDDQPMTDVEADALEQQIADAITSDYQGSLAARIMQVVRPSFDSLREQIQAHQVGDGYTQGWEHGVQAATGHHQSTASTSLSPADLVGEDVVLYDEQDLVKIRGRVVGYAEKPSVLIDTDSGKRVLYSADCRAVRQVLEALHAEHHATAMSLIATDDEKTGDA